MTPHTKIIALCASFIFLCADPASARLLTTKQTEVLLRLNQQALDLARDSAVSTRAALDSRPNGVGAACYDSTLQAIVGVESSLSAASPFAALDSELINASDQKASQKYGRILFDSVAGQLQGHRNQLLRIRGLCSDHIGPTSDAQKAIEIIDQALPLFAGPKINLLPR